MAAAVGGKQQSAIKMLVSRALRETGSAMKLGSGGEIFSRHRPTMKFDGITPFYTNDTFIAPTACIVGDVTNWDKSSVWFNSVVRGDSVGYASINIGVSSSIGDNSSVLTLPPGLCNHGLRSGLSADTHIGHYVTVGTGCVLKSCRIEDLVIIGNGCTILEGSLIESNVMLEDQTVVLPYQRIPSGQRWGGNPAQYISDLTNDEKMNIKKVATSIYDLAMEYQEEFLPYGYSYVHLEEIQQKEEEQAAAAANAAK